VLGADLVYGWLVDMHMHIMPLSAVIVTVPMKHFLENCLVSELKIKRCTNFFLLL